MFDKIAKSLGRNKPEPSSVDAAAEALLADLPSLRPKLAGSLREEFCRKVTSERLTGTVEMLASLADVPAAVQRYIDARAISGPVTISADTLLAGLDWCRLPTTDEITSDRGLAIGVARLAIAETGSVVMASSPATPSLQNYLPLHHMVVVMADRIRGHLEDVWDAIDPAEHRLVSLITGTSGTADIEGRNVRGAHGPRYLHILLIDSP